MLSIQPQAGPQADNGPRRLYGPGAKLHEKGSDMLDNAGTQAISDFVLTCVAPDGKLHPHVY